MVMKNMIGLLCQSQHTSVSARLNTCGSNALGVEEVCEKSTSQEHLFMETHLKGLLKFNLKTFNLKTEKKPIFDVNSIKILIHRT